MFLLSLNYSKAREGERGGGERERDCISTLHSPTIKDAIQFIL